MHKVTYKSDVWSFGVVLYEIFEQGIPYKELSPIEVESMVANNQIQLQLSLRIKGEWPVIDELMKKCFQFTPTDRPNFKQIVEFLDKKNFN